MPAERNPGAFHGVSAFNIRQDPDVSPKDSYSTVFGQTLARAATQDNRICAVTAAMKYGTGLQYFKKLHPERFFDVGIAEGHAVTFAAGLAREGLLPVVAIYSTFLQRSYDQIIHDVMLGKMNVLFAIDRAGLVPDDGDTHQGIYDAAYLSQQSGMPVVSPGNYAELRWWLKKLLAEGEGPRAIRYPRGTEAKSLADKECTGLAYDKLLNAPGANTALVTYGSETPEALEAARQLEGEAACYQMVVINPVPQGLVDELLSYQHVVFAEEGIRQGGIGEHVAVQLYQRGFKGSFRHIAVPETGVDHATVDLLRQQLGLDADSLVQAVREEQEKG